MSSDLLEVLNVEKSFGGVPAVDGAALVVREHSITALIGPNGAGKTTLFNIIAGSLRADGGHILLDGQEILGLAPHRLVSVGVVRTFQLSRVLRRMTVLENMLVAGQDNPGERLTGLIFRRAVGRAESRLREWALELLARVRLEARCEDLAGELSVGQQKLLEFARALMPKPRLLLLDEPLAGVNPALADNLLEQVQDLRNNADLTFFFIEHDLQAVMSISDKVVVMDAGRVIADGSPEAIRSNSKVIEAYIGR